jgi:hypothetical protein
LLWAQLGGCRVFLGNSLESQNSAKYALKSFLHYPSFRLFQQLE